MSTTIQCPTCGTRLAVPDTGAESLLTCPMCAGQIVIAKPVERNRDRVEEEESAPPRRRRSSNRRREFDYDEDDRSIRVEFQYEADAPGTVGVVLGAFATLFLLASCITWGLAYCIALPTATLGLFCSLFGKGSLRVIGITLNLLSLLPALFFLLMSVFFVGAAAVAPVK